MNQQKHRLIQFFLIKVYKMKRRLLVYAPGVKLLSQQMTEEAHPAVFLGHTVCFLPPSLLLRVKLVPKTAG